MGGREEDLLVGFGGWVIVADASCSPLNSPIADFEVSEPHAAGLFCGVQSGGGGMIVQGNRGLHPD